MKTLALSGLVLGSTLAVGVAQADSISLTPELMDGVTASGTAFVDVNLNVWKDKHINSFLHIVKKKDIFQNVHLNGFFADAEAGSNCFGFACEALTMTVTDVDAFKFQATSYSESEAAAEGFRFDHKDPKFDHKDPKVR